MAEVIIYTRQGCGYCSAAKRLLGQKGAKYQEFDATVTPDKRAEMIQRSGRSTFPQIFIDGKHIGGCDDLYALDQRGELDTMLGA
ncbi:glutaredoxin 3 [Faunimonas pinastri]|uniref:Glutaredoxin n=1 Tax=Faunimonas pinastri TaxID=1855383 RepID=A0A1H9NAW0_9HYPH|nr:glutaredoxin 3 [Faunimonas pinastri]SER33062.1 glutaredoxin 3 [Faunimonas pinastri]